LILSKYISCFLFSIEHDTDEETDKLLSNEHRINEKNQAIRDAVCIHKKLQEEKKNFLLVIGCFKTIKAT